MSGGQEGWDLCGGQEGEGSVWGTGGGGVCVGDRRGGVCVGNRRGRGLCRIGAKGNGWLQVIMCYHWLPSPGAGWC